MFTFILFHLGMCDIKLTNKYLAKSTIFKHCMFATQGTTRVCGVASFNTTDEQLQ